MLSNIWYSGILNIERDLLSSILEFQMQNQINIKIKNTLCYNLSLSIGTKE